MNTQLLCDSISLLKEFRDELRGEVDDSRIDKLDRIIVDLEEAYYAKEDISAFYVLEKIGLAFELLQLIDYVIKKFQ